MELKIYKDYTTLSQHVAAEIISVIKNKPNAVICLASGDSPRLTCKLFAERVNDEGISLALFTFIGLDEWVGIPPASEGSCRYFFDSLLINPLHLSPAQVNLFNGLSDNLAGECKKMDQTILNNGGIDLMIVGVGMNGHIGFNEPGVSFDNYSHVIDLDDVTVSVGQKYFKGATKLKQGITLGLKHLMESKKVILIANGTKKAPIIKKAITSEVSSDFPATIIQKHANGAIMIDEEAASLLQQ